MHNDAVNPKSIDFISKGCLKFGQFLRFLNSDCLSLGSQILEFLIESIQGPCPKNQIALTESKVVEFTKQLMQMFSKESDYKLRGLNTQKLVDDANYLVSKSTKLLFSLLEGN